MTQAMRKTVWTALAGLAIQSMAGCMNSNADGEAPPTSPGSAVQLPGGAVPPAQSPQPAPGNGDPSLPVDSNASSPQPAFQPPFPNREDLFLPPADKPAIATRARSDDDVVLMGFADVEGKNALLRIDGIITPLRAGEARGAIRVLTVDPPRVTLQRGSRQWTERLFDAP